MGLTIKKHYEENVQTKPFHFVKIGLTISSDKVLSTPAEVEHASAGLNLMAKNLVRKELKQVKEEAEGRES